jgi:hypothetical protein
MAETAFLRFTSCVAPELSGTQENKFQSLSRPGPDGSRARQDWVHEHAETGKPLAAYKLHGTRGPQPTICAGWGAKRKSIGPSMPRSVRAARPCTRQGWNGPAAGNRLVASGLVGHKLSAIGSLHHSACSACSSSHPSQFAAFRGWPARGYRHTSDSQVIPSAHPPPVRSTATPSRLAAWRFAN